MTTAATIYILFIAASMSDTDVMHAEFDADFRTKAECIAAAAENNSNPANTTYAFCVAEE